MFVFMCAGRGARLTIPLSQVPLPTHAHQKYGNGFQLPVLMESGTFAVDPEPWGPPWRKWEMIDPDEAAARGIYAPVYALSEGAPGAIVIAPGDTRGTVLIPGKGGGYCCGLDWGDGPNMACEAMPGREKTNPLDGSKPTGARWWESVSSNVWKSTRTRLEAVTGTGCVMRAILGRSVRVRT